MIWVGASLTNLLLMACGFQSPKFVAFIKSWNVEKNVKSHDAELMKWLTMIVVAGKQFFVVGSSSLQQPLLIL